MGMFVVYYLAYILELVRLYEFLVAPGGIPPGGYLGCEFKAFFLVRPDDVIVNTGIPVTVHTRPVSECAPFSANQIIAAKRTGFKIVHESSS